MNQRYLNSRQNKNCRGRCIQCIGNANVMKGPPADRLSVYLSVRQYLCLSACLSVGNSVPLTKCNIQSLPMVDDKLQTWTVGSYIGSSHFTDIPCSPGCQNVGLRYVCHILTLLLPGHLCFTSTYLVDIVKDVTLLWTNGYILAKL